MTPWRMFFPFRHQVGARDITIFLFTAKPSLRSSHVFPVVASLPPENSDWLKSSYVTEIVAARVRGRSFSEGEKRRPEIRLRFAGYTKPGTRFLFNCTLEKFCLVSFVHIRSARQTSVTSTGISRIFKTYNR